MILALNLPVSLSARNSPVVVRRATPRDLHAIMRLLADDAISAGRGDSNSPDDERAYADALERIIAEPNNELIVVVDENAAVVGTLQLTAIPGMARRGSTRILVEAVRVSSTERSAGIGGAVMRWVMGEVAGQVGASIVQLTSDAAREDAHRFYTRLGFVDSHVGFKYNVPVPLGGA
ncbi:GNAT family N-acetyltransferase [Micrococcales bacterium 31B]|nr:GNAT family N-acetyltransferase [Micrococcales bacterium 31B]